MRFSGSAGDRRAMLTPWATSVTPCGVKPIHLIRYGLPAAIAIAGTVVLVVGSADPYAVAAGVTLIGVALLVFLVDVFARLAISSQDDREREERAREERLRRGRGRRR